jgi:hypothetical protein
MLLWISAGLYFDIIHGIANFVLGFLVLPLKKVIETVEKRIRR